MAKRAMVVDDSKTTRTMVAFTLRRAGYEVIEAEDGRGALALLDGAPMDCIITDINMPVMDGIALIRAIRAIPAHRATPILMLTTEGDTGKKEAGQAAGATGWLGKPFHPTALLQTIEGLPQTV